MHAIIDAAFERSRTVLLVLGFLLVSGVVAYQDIPKESEPDVPIPVIYVSMAHDGISPEDAERLLVRPMEKELQSIGGVKEMTSTASEGFASVQLEFDAGFDGDQALADVRERVDAAKSQLPAATEEPGVDEVNISLFPILAVSLSGPLPERALINIARELQEKLEALPGVLEAEIAGEREEVLEIEVDPLVMESYAVDYESLFRLVGNNNLLVAAGAIESAAGRMVLKVPGVIEDVGDVMSLPVKVTDEAVVRFGDVATIRRTYEDPDGFARLDGQPTLVLEISKRLGANIIETVEAVRATIDAERERLPPSLAIGFHQDKSEETRTMLTDLQNNVVSGVVLVVIVIMATLGVRSAILVGFAIPGSFLSGILVIYALGHTMNVVVLFSLILVVGMLVDGAIIVSELADRNIERGLDRSAAYAAAAKRMAWPVIASTFTTLAVFFPMLFWPGLIGQFMIYMPITVISCLLASLAMALVFVPVIGKLIGRRGGDERRRIEGGRIEDERIEGARIESGLDADGRSAIAASGGGRRDDERTRHGAGPSGAAFAAPEDEIPDGVTVRTLLDGARGARARYLRVLHALLLRPLATFGAVLGVAVASYVLYGLLGKGVEFFPSIEPPSSALRVHARGDLSIHEKDRIMRRVEAGLIGLPEVESVYTRTGGDNRGAADQIGSVQLEFVDWDERRKAAVITRELRQELSRIAGVRLEFVANEGGPDGGAKPITLQVGAPTQERLHAAVDELRDLMDELGGFVDVDDNRPLPGIEWRLEVDRERAARYGADIALVGNAVQLLTSGIRIAGYRPDDASDELDIRVRYPREARTLDRVTALRVPSADGPVPLSHFVTLEPAPKTGTIHRVGGRRVVTVAADVAEGRLVDTELGRLRDALAERATDPGASIRFAGEAEEQAEAVNFLIVAFLSALFLMALILVTQFNSAYQALLVLSAVLFSTAGVLIGLLVTAQPFGIVMVGIGIIALAGIVVNNNIVLIDTYNACRRRGLAAVEAALLTGSMRVRPVCLTAITTILGLMPMVLSMNIDLIDRELTFGAPSTQWWTQLASAIAGGLAFTTLLTLFLTPCLLVLGARLGERWASRREDAHGRHGRLASYGDQRRRSIR